MRIFTLLLAFTIGMPMAQAQFQSKMGEILLSAQRAHIETDPTTQSHTIILTGNVQVIYRGQHMTANEIRINQQTKEIEAIGDVVLMTPTVSVQGSRVHLKSDDNTGEIYDAFLEAGQVQLSGSRIEKTGPDAYSVDEGRYTACVTCPPGWSFSGSHIHAELGSYTSIRNPILRIGGVPILWLPYLIVPLKNERQSGLLFPTFESSNDSGFTFGESFYWAVNPSSDATLGWKNYANRGNKVLGQYRYVLSPHDRGQLDTAYMQDRSVPGGSIERYFLKYDHLYNLPDGFTQRLDLNYMSDLRYPKDFNTEVLGYGEPALENRASLTRNTARTSTTIETAYYINLLHSTMKSDNRDAIHRAPEIDTTLTPQRVGIGNLQFKAEAQYANFQRDSTSFNYQTGTCIDPSTGYTISCPTPIDPNGIFNPDADLYRAGQRFDIYPSFDYPFTLGPVDIQPTIGFREQHYYFANTLPNSQTGNPGSALSNRPEAQRRFIRSEISMLTRLSHVYGDQTHVDSLRYRHEIVPELRYSAIPYLQSTSHPFFGGIQDVLPFAARDIPVSDRDLLQFDYRDRLYERDVMTVAVTNNLTRRQWVNDRAEYRQIASLRLSQSYDFYENYRSGVSTRRPYSDISALLDVRFENLEINSFTQHYPYQNVAQTASRARLYDPNGNFIQAEYDKQYSIQQPVQGVQTYLLDTSSGANENISAGFGLLTPFATFLGSIQYSLSASQLSSYTIGTDVRPPGNCWILSFNYIKNFQTAGIFGFNFSLLYDGKTAAPINKM